MCTFPNTLLMLNPRYDKNNRKKIVARLKYNLWSKITKGEGLKVTYYNTRCEC